VFSIGPEGGPEPGRGEGRTADPGRIEAHVGGSGGSEMVMCQETT